MQLTPAVDFKQHYVSPNITISSGLVLPQAHGLTSIPTLAQAHILCLTAEIGYSIGDNVIVSQGTATGGCLLAVDGINVTGVPAKVLPPASPTNPQARQQQSRQPTGNSCCARGRNRCRSSQSLRYLSCRQGRRLAHYLRPHCRSLEAAAVRALRGIRELQDRLAPRDRRAQPAWLSPSVSNCFSGNQSTAFGSTTKAIVGSKRYFDPNATMWHLTGTSTITFYMLLETTNAGIAAAGDLLQQTGTGSPVIVASVPTTTGITATLVSVNVSTAFRPGANAGIFVARCWITTANGNDYATCTGAWLEFIP